MTLFPFAFTLADTIRVTHYLPNTTYHISNNKHFSGGRGELGYT